MHIIFTVVALDSLGHITIKSSLMFQLLTQDDFYKRVIYLFIIGFLILKENMCISFISMCMITIKMLFLNFVATVKDSFVLSLSIIHK